MESFVFVLKYVHNYFKTKTNDSINMNEFLSLYCTTQEDLQVYIGRFYKSLENMILEEIDEAKKQTLQRTLDKYKAVSHSLLFMSFWWCVRGS